MRFLFLTALALMIIISVYAVKGISNGRKKISGFVYAIGFAMLITGILDLWNMLDAPEYHGAFFLCGITAGLEIYLSWVNTFISEKNTARPVISTAIKVIAAAAVLELTLFNMSSYHLWLGNYEESRLLLNSAAVSGGKSELNEMEETLVIAGKDEVLITYEGLDKPVGTLKVDMDFLGSTKTANVVVDITDDSHMTYRYDIVKEKAVKDVADSMIMPCFFSGDVGTFRVKFKLDSEKDGILLKSIFINKDIPFNISYMRWMMIITITVLASVFANSSRLKLSFYKNKSFCNAAAAVITVICVVLAFRIVTFKSGITTFGSFADQFKATTGNQISQELVDAFEAGQVSLLDEVEPELLEIDNPYDWSQRNEHKVSGKWDHVMYNGKYYSYYGIAPVILLFLPYHILTGYYFPTNIAVMLFSIVGIIFLSMTYMAFIRKFFWKISSSMVLCGLLVIQISSGIWYSVTRTLFYEISISSGFAFVTLGAYFLITSNITGWGNISLPRTALSSLFLAMAVLCRPTLAVYCMAACVFYLFGFSKCGSNIIETEEGARLSVDKKSRPAYAACAFIPMFVLAAVQMYYNYIRFDSPLDFGIQYSLTINDFTHAQYHTNFVLIGIYNYLFAPPSFKMEFPFITTPFTKLNVNGYYFSDSGNVSGILFMSLPVFAYFFSKKAYKLADKKNRLKNALLIGIPCVLMPFVIICSVWESGYAVRYLADFSWEITVGALAVLFTLYMKADDKKLREIYEKFMIAAVIWGFVMNVTQIFNFSFSASKYPEFYYNIAGIFEFWR